MNKSYQIHIPNDRLRQVTLINAFVFLANLLAFFAVFINAPAPLRYLAIPLALVNLVSLLLAFRGIKPGMAALSLFLTSFGWLGFGHVLPALVLPLLALISYFSQRKLVIDFNKEGIRYPSFPAKFFPWASVEQVILKDGILTIDLKNNHLLQFTLVHEPAFPELEFNNYCKEQLSFADTAFPTPE